jgi:hypothetical protein
MRSAASSPARPSSLVLTSKAQRISWMQLEHGLAQRRAAHPELFAELFFRQIHPRRIGSENDPVANGLENVFR